MIIEDSLNDNLDKVERMVSEAVAVFSPDFVCLPEYFSMPRSFWNAELGEAFDNVSRPTYSFLKELSNRHKIVLIGGTVVEREGNNFYNTCYIFKNGNLLGKYRKMNITPFEQKWSLGNLKAGKDCFFADTESGKIGVLICYDICFPENLIRLSSMGTKAIFLPMSEPYEGHPADDSNAKTIENCISTSAFILKTSCVGKTQLGKLIGTKTAIVSPKGVVKAAKSDITDEIVSADLRTQA